VQAMRGVKNDEIAFLFFKRECSMLYPKDVRDDCRI
jgi:hypothetical protein